MNEAEPSPPPSGQFLVYQTEDGKLAIVVRSSGKTVCGATDKESLSVRRDDAYSSQRDARFLRRQSPRAGQCWIQKSVVKESFTTAMHAADARPVDAAFDTAVKQLQKLPKPKKPKRPKP